MCLWLSGFPSEGAGMGEGVMHMSSECVPLSTGSFPTLVLVLAGSCHLPARQQLPSNPTGLLGRVVPACLQLHLAFSPSFRLKAKDKCLTMDFCHHCDAQRAFSLCSCFRFCFCFASVLSKIAAPSKK